MNDLGNPYLAPEAELLAPAPMNRSTHRLAGKGRRLATLFIDYFCFLVCSFTFGILVALIFGESGVQALQNIPNLLLGIFIMTSYYAFFEGIWGRTPAKFVLGTVVVTENGKKPSFPRILGRTLCRFIPFEPFSFLGERGWHDSISKTQVVYIR